MSLFGGFDMDDDPIFGSHMRTMRHMNSMMNSLFADPFGMMGMGAFGGFDRGLTHRNMHSNMHPNMHPSMHNGLMPFGMPVMPNMNRLLSGSLDSGMDGGHHSHFSSSSTVVSMTSGPDGRPQVYKATSSTRCAPGGVKETQRTVTDSRTGTKKMAIGHHIGERAHIVEKEQNMHTGDREEREDFINLEEDEAEDFNKEWEHKTSSRSEIPRITGSAGRQRHSYAGHTSTVPAITAGPSRRHRERQTTTTPLASPRRSIRSTHLTNLNNSIVNISRTSPYSPSGNEQMRKRKNIKTVNGSPPPPADD